MWNLLLTNQDFRACNGGKNVSIEHLPISWISRVCRQKLLSANYMKRLNTIITHVIQSGQKQLRLASPQEKFSDLWKGQQY